MTLKHFTVPCENIKSVFSEERLRSQVVIVSIIGKTAPEDNRRIDLPKVVDDLDELMQSLGAQKDSSIDMSLFESYFDPDENVVYVSLIGPSDNAKTNLTSIASIKEQIENNGFLNYWSSAQIAYARALLFLFSFSHIVLYTNPSCFLNVKIIQLFKVLSFVRPKYQGTIAKVLAKNHEISEEWINHGRLCSPRLIFLFKDCPYEILKEENKCERISQIKKLEHSLEDHIYMTLRQSRIVKDVCNRTLFSIAPNDEFVFVGLNSEFKPRKHKLDVYFEKIKKHFDSLCVSPSIMATNSEWINDLPEEKNEFIGRLFNHSSSTSFPISEESNADIPSDFSESDSEHSNSDEEIFEIRESTQMPRHSLKELVLRHVRKAHSEGFSDNMGKFSNMKPFFEVPTLRTWLLAVNTVLHNPESGLKEPNSTSSMLGKLLGTELKFSNARCKKVLPLALAIYQENLPAHYNEITHDKQMKRAVAVFSHHARGPAQQKFIEQLKDECERVWKTGRQTCEALSLNKNTCTKPKHLSSSSNGLLQIGESEHWSGVQFYSSCNCGAKQGPRQDPFTLRAANYDFYQIIGQECGCIHYDTIHFSVFQPSTSDFREADLNNPHPTINIIQEVQNELQEIHLASPTLSTGKAWNVHESPHEGEVAMSIPLSTIYLDQASNIALNYYSHTHNEKHLVRQPSTTEYLPGMVHLESPVGLLPQFPSWSLLCRGPSSLYSHNLGLHDCPGFIPGSSYLLPWDVSFREKDICKSDPPENFKKAAANRGVQILKPGNRRPRATKEFMSVKIFIGVEYECVRGHRFMSSAPGVVLKATGASVKEDAHKITEGNMPLFFPCPCGKMIAQLMRVHIVTPKAPVFVTIEPKVRPAPPPCPTFVSGEPKPIALSQSAYWVLRLPYVYASERKVFSIPNRMKNFKFGELLGPMYGITQADI